MFSGRWAVQLASEYDSSVSIPEKHEAIITAFGRHERPWGIRGLPLPSAPKPNCPIATRSLTRLIKSPVRFCEILYAYRPKEYWANYRPRDIINLEFNWQKVDAKEYLCLLNEVLPDYIMSFDAQQLRASNQQVYLDYMRDNDYARKRTGCEFIAPVNFWSEKVCQLTFNCGLDSVEAVLNREEVRTRRINDGIYVVFSDSLLAAENNMDFEHKFRSLLTQ